MTTYIFYPTNVTTSTKNFNADEIDERSNPVLFSPNNASNMRPMTEGIIVVLIRIFRLAPRRSPTEMGSTAPKKRVRRTDTEGLLVRR